MINETDLAQTIFLHMTRDLYLTSSGRLRYRVLAENAAREIMQTIRAEREMLDRRRSRVVIARTGAPAHAD